MIEVRMQILDLDVDLPTGLCFHSQRSLTVFCSIGALQYRFGRWASREVRWILRTLCYQIILLHIKTPCPMPKFKSKAGPDRRIATCRIKIPTRTARGPDSSLHTPL